jgi:ketosteroid isomerase-like protein
MRKFFQEGMSAFDPYRYAVAQVYELLDPEVLIAEYSSDSRLLASGALYRNQYLGIFRFRDGLVSHWREYLNPHVVAAVLATLPGPSKP